MPVPLALAAPAAVASLAYLNARSGLWFDLQLLKSVGLIGWRCFTRERRDTLNLFYTFEAHAQNPQTASRPFLLFEDRSHTYAHCYETILRYGSWLKSKHGVEPGDVVAMDFQNSDTFFFVWWALWSIGAKPAFINYNLTGKPLAHCIKAASTRLCLIDPNVAEAFEDGSIQEELSNVSFVIFTPEAEAEAAASPPERSPDADRGGQLTSTMAVLIYTSGTTGLPKPAIVSWGKCYSGSTLGEVLLGRGGDDIMYTSMPLYHSSAALLSLCATVFAGTTQAIGRKFSTKLFWQDVRAHKATMIQYVGETLRYLLAAPPQLDPLTGENLDRKHHVELAFGNGLRPDIWDKFKDRFGVGTIVEFYAATEAPHATWNVSKNSLTAGAIGRTGWLYHLVLGNTTALVDVDWETELPRKNPKTGFCIKVKSGEPGEMLFRLPAEDIGTRFQGYYNNPNATNSKILRDVFSKGDAWFRTGDVIRWDSDGRVYFSDRIGDTFRWKSENVSTAEVSHAVGLHPAVSEANVYGVELPHHDGRAGCVAISFGSVPDTDTLRSLAAHVRQTLPRYAQPLFLRLVTDIGNNAQTTGTNKQQKHNLRVSGVRPVAGGDELFWLKDDSYVPFGEKEWKELDAGRVKL